MFVLPDFCWIFVDLAPILERHIWISASVPEAPMTLPRSTNINARMFDSLCSCLMMKIASMNVFDCIIDENATEILSRV